MDETRLNPLSVSAFLDCLNVPNSQLNSISLFPNTNELNYGRPTNYYSSHTTSTTKPPVNSYSRRSFAHSSTNKSSNNRNDKSEINRPSDNRTDKNQSNKSLANRPMNNLNCNTPNYSSSPSNYQPKSALLGGKQPFCKQCVPPDTYHTMTTTPTNYNYNQKYFYPTPFQSFQSSATYQRNQSNTIQPPSNKHLQQPKYYASDTSKQQQQQAQSNRNQRASKSNHHLISQPPALLTTTPPTPPREGSKANSTGGYTPSSKQESDYYSELIRYVNSNHISAFKSHKRVDLDTGRTHSMNDHHGSSNELVNNKERTSNSVTASSSPISEHYDFSSEESEQTNYKHTTLLSYPTNYSANYGYANSYSSNYSSNYSNNSSLSSSSTNKKTVKVNKKSATNNDSQMNERNVDAIDHRKLVDGHQSSKILINNDDKDDGYEDDFELKNCDTKSNEEIAMETDQIIEEELIEERTADSQSECNLDPKSDDRYANETDDESDRKSDECSDDNNRPNDSRPTVESSDQNDKKPECDNRTEFAKDDVIIDENSNEIRTVDRNSVAVVGNQINVESSCTDCAKDDKRVARNCGKANVEEQFTNDFKKSLDDAIAREPADDEQATKPMMKKKSESVKIVTFALSYTKLTANSVNLKWTVLNNGSNLYALAKENQFMVEMIYTKGEKSIGQENRPTAETINRASRIVFTGLVKHCKIQCLKPFEEYSFRVKLLYKDYQLISNLLTITTPELQIQPMSSTKKRTSKHNLQFSLQQQQILKQQQIIIEQKEKELQLNQTQFNQQTSSRSSISLFGAIGSLFRDNFAYLLLICFSISAFFFADFISKDLLN